MGFSFSSKLVNGITGDPVVLLKHQRTGDRLLFDLGDITRLSHREVLKTSHVFISHTHVDHFFGFDRLLRFNIPHKRDIFLYGPKGLASNVQAKIKGYTWNLIDSDQLSFFVTEIDTDGVVCGRAHIAKANDFMIRSMPFSKKDDLCVLSDGSVVRAFSLDHNGIQSIAYHVETLPLYRVNEDAITKLGLVPGAWIADFLEAIKKPKTDNDTLLIDGSAHKLGALKSSILASDNRDSFAYLTDFAFNAKNIDILCKNFPKAVHLVIECSFKEEHLHRAVAKAHLSSRQAALIGAKLACAEFEPFHVSNIYGDASREAIEESRRFYDMFKLMDEARLQEEILKELNRVNQCRSDLGVV